MEGFAQERFFGSASFASAAAMKRSAFAWGCGLLVHPEVDAFVGLGADVGTLVGVHDREVREHARGDDALVVVLAVVGSRSLL